MNRQIKLSPSMLCSDYAHLARDIEQLNMAGADMLHLDIMDGHFVPNIAMGFDYVKTVRRLSHSKCDIHLMALEPERLIAPLELERGERLCFHVEATKHPHRLADTLKKAGIQTGAALNPGTSLCQIEELLPVLDFVHILLVNPGFAGQPLVSAMLDKVRRLRAMADARGHKLEIEVDGSVQFDNLFSILDAGADVLVLGPYTCFNVELGGIGPTIKRVRSELERYNSLRA